MAVLSIMFTGTDIARNTFMIEDEDIDKEVLMNNDGSSPLRGRMNGSAFELGRKEQENPGVIT